MQGVGTGAHSSCSIAIGAVDTSETTVCRSENFSPRHTSSAWQSARVIFFARTRSLSHFLLLNLYHTCLGSTPRKTTSHLSRTPWLSAAIETIRGNSAARAAAFSAPRGDSTMELHGGEGRVLHPDSKLAGKELVGSESVRTRNSPDSAHHSARHCANADKAVCGHRRRERACAGCCAEQD
jgi:hypothetical protein